MMRHCFQQWWRAGLASALLMLIPAAAHAQMSDHQHGKSAKDAKSRPARPQPAISAAFSPDGRLWVVGVNGEGKLYVRTAVTTSADTLGSPRIIDSGNDTIAAEGESRPKIVFGPHPWAVITYTQPLAKPYTGEIRMLRSEDGGVNFSLPYTVHQDRQIITHRFDSAAFDAKGTLHTLWIDKRDGEALKAAKADKGAKREAAYRGAAIYRNESKDGGKTFGPDLKLADHSCECCRIALAPDPAGGLVAMWRHVFEPNERDHAIASVGQAITNQTPTRATYDRWALDACPHHGPGLAPANNGGYHAVWFGEKAGKAAVRYGLLDAKGQPKGSPVELPDARAEHADVRSAGSNVVISWRSFDGERTHWRVWVSRDAGATFVVKNVASVSGVNDYPILLSRGSEIFGLWNAGERIRIERLAD